MGRGRPGDVERAREGMEFFFRTAKGTFCMNLWEIDYLRGKRKAGKGRACPAQDTLPAHKRVLEVGAQETSRKFMTCVRKYLLFYLRLLHQLGDAEAIGRVGAAIKTDKKYAASLGDLVPVAVAKQLVVVVGGVRGAGEGEERREALESVFRFAVDHFGLWQEEVEKGLREAGEDCGEAAAFTCRCVYEYLDFLEQRGLVGVFEWAAEFMRQRYVKGGKKGAVSAGLLAKLVLEKWVATLAAEVDKVAERQTPVVHTSLTPEAQEVAQKAAALVSGSHDGSLISVLKARRPAANPASPPVLGVDPVAASAAHVVTGGVLSQHLVQLAPLSPADVDVAASLLASARALFRERFLPLLLAKAHPLPDLQAEAVWLLPGAELPRDWLLKSREQTAELLAAGKVRRGGGAARSSPSSPLGGGQVAEVCEAAFHLVHGRAAEGAEMANWGENPNKESLVSKKPRFNLGKASPAVARKAQQALGGPIQTPDPQSSDNPPPSEQYPTPSGIKNRPEAKQAERSPEDGVSARTLGVTQKKIIPILPIRRPESGEIALASPGSCEAEEASWQAGVGDEAKKRKTGSPNGGPKFEWTSASPPPFSTTPSPSSTTANYILALAAPRQGEAVGAKVRVKKRKSSPLIPTGLPTDDRGTPKVGEATPLSVLSEGEELGVRDDVQAQGSRAGFTPSPTAGTNVDTGAAVISKRGSEASQGVKGAVGTKRKMGVVEWEEVPI